MTDADARAAMRERAEEAIDGRVQESKNRYWRPLAQDLARDVLALDAEVTALREAVRDAAEAEEHLAMRARSDNDLEGAAIHSHCAATLRALAGVPAPEEGDGDGR